MTGRVVEEWIGKHPDQAVPPRVRLRIFEREGGRCYLSGRKIMAGDQWDLDHKVPLCMGGRHAESNLFPALRDKHREKTRADVALKAKADRVRKKHLGIKPKSGRKLQGRGFDKTKSRRFDGSVVERGSR